MKIKTSNQKLDKMSLAFNKNKDGKLARKLAKKYENKKLNYAVRENKRKVVKDSLLSITGLLNSDFVLFL
jgi:hypothetical protein